MIKAWFVGEYKSYYIPLNNKFAYDAIKSYFSPKQYLQYVTGCLIGNNMCIFMMDGKELHCIRKNNY